MLRNPPPPSPSPAGSLNGSSVAGRGRTTTTRADQDGPWTGVTRGVQAPSAVGGDARGATLGAGRVRHRTTQLRVTIGVFRTRFTEQGRDGLLWTRGWHVSFCWVKTRNQVMHLTNGQARMNQMLAWKIKKKRSREPTPLVGY